MGAVGGGEGAAALVEQSQSLVGQAHGGVGPGLVGAQDGSRVCAAAGLSGVTALELCQRLGWGVVVQVNAADSVVDVGDERVVAVVPGQGQRVLEVTVRVGDLAGVEADPARQVVQVGHGDPQSGGDPVAGLRSEELVPPGQVVEHGGVTATAAVAVVVGPPRAGDGF